MAALNKKNPPAKIPTGGYQPTPPQGSTNTSPYTNTSQNTYWMPDGRGGMTTLPPTPGEVPAAAPATKTPAASGTGAKNSKKPAAAPIKDPAAEWAKGYATNKPVEGLKQAMPTPAPELTVGPPIVPEGPASGGGSMGMPRAPMETTSVGGPGGGGIGGGPGLQWLEAPTKLKAGLGTRMPPMLSAVLAGLGRSVY